MKKEFFCNTDCNLAKFIPEMVIDKILGESLKDEIDNRYNDMRNNFDFN